MVMGFDKFRDHFRGFEDNYIIIGGSACDWLMSHEGDQPFRATHDIDLVLCAEEMSEEFGHAIWSFVHDGGYSVYERKDGRKSFFRFMAPTTPGYPSMLEFFSREPMDFPLAENAVIIPVPIDGDVSSLSGILLDLNYYSFIRSYRHTIDGVCVLSAEGLLLLKARAWMDFINRKSRGDFVKEKDLRKHRTDIVRLAAMISVDEPIPIAPSLMADYDEFLQTYAANPTDPASVGLPGVEFNAIMERLRALFVAGAKDSGNGTHINMV